MTPEQFQKYCRRNTPKKIIADEQGVAFHFKVRVIINVFNGIDGLIYVKARKARKGEGAALFSDLREMASKFIDGMKRKYLKPITIK